MSVLGCSFFAQTPKDVNEIHSHLYRNISLRQKFNSFRVGGILCAMTARNYIPWATQGSYPQASEWVTFPYRDRVPYRSWTAGRECWYFNSTHLHMRISRRYAACVRCVCDVKLVFYGKTSEFWVYCHLIKSVILLLSFTGIVARSFETVKPHWVVWTIHLITVRIRRY